MPEVSFLAWQKQFSTEDDCLKYLQKMKWENGFICPSCGNYHNYKIASRHLYECTQCKSKPQSRQEHFFMVVKSP